MFYPILKAWIRLALRIFLRDVTIQNPPAFAMQGPLLITANHPDSFLDAIIIAAACRYPVHFLARGDAFNKPWHARLLRLLQMIPVYRLSEGKENLALNETSFRKSREVLESNGILLVFIEGICVNKHALQPFKKGCARIAIDCRHLPGMQVLPMAICYDSFSRFGKTIFISAGKPKPVNELLPFPDESKNMRSFNEVIFREINGMINIPHRKPVANKNPAGQIFAQLGRLLHWPLYTILSKTIRAKTRNTVFYDSVLFGALLLIYPVYLLLTGFLLILFGLPVWSCVIIVLLHPFTARLAVQYAR